MIFIILGGVIITVLAIIAFRLQQQVKQKEQQQEEQKQLFEENEQRNRSSMNKSIQVLAQGLVSDQLTKTEAAIRISVLLEYLGVDASIKEEYSALFQLAEATAHIPILEQWKALPTKEKLRYDKEREELEKTYGDFVLDAAKRISGKSF